MLSPGARIGIGIGIGELSCALSAFDYLQLVDLCCSHCGSALDLRRWCDAPTPDKAEQSCLRHQQYWHARQLAIQCSAGLLSRTGIQSPVSPVPRTDAQRLRSSHRIRSCTYCVFSRSNLLGLILCAHSRTSRISHSRLLSTPLLRVPRRKCRIRLVRLAMRKLPGESHLDISTLAL